MQATSAKRFLHLLEKSGLVLPEQLGPALRELKISSAGAIVDLDQLASHLIDRGLITEWHRDKLSAGKHRGFFLGKYKLLGHLGTGGMSTVYLAEHTISGQRRAIKVLPRKKVADKSYLDRFYREGRASAALDHPNIVRVYDIAGKDTTHYMVMEFVEGTDLYELVKQNGPVDYDTAVKYILQAAIGLQHAHERKLVHRDIKPANLLVSPGGTVKILDLGLALLKSEEEESLTVMHNERVMGTADYLAPEQAVNSHNVDHRADVYSLGCTLYYMLTGHPPFPEGTLAQRIVAHQTKEPEDIRQSQPECPARLVQICQKMMRKKRSERFQDCSELILTLDAYRNPQQHTDAEFQSLVSVPNFEFSVVTNRTKDPPIDETIQTGSENEEAKGTKKSKIASGQEQDVAISSIRRKKMPIGMIVSIASLLLFTVALAFVVVRNSIKNSDRAVTRAPDAEGRTGTTTNAGNSSDNSRSTTSFNGNGKEPSSSRKSPVYSAGDQSTAPVRSLATIKFEADEGFRDNSADWPIYANNQQIGTLLCKRQCDLFDEPRSGKKCLLVFGDTERVEFRPLDENERLKEIRFSARRQNNNTPFSFLVQAKTLDRFERWQTVFQFDSTIDDLNSKEYSEIVITDKELELINAQKFRFKLEGDRQNGILIDDLSITLER